MRPLLFYAAAAVVLAAAGPSHAQRVQPMVFDLAPSGADAATTLRVENTRTGPVTVEITAAAIAVDENGEETRTPADADFQIFPPQSLIAAGRTQAFRVRYVGEPRLEQSRSYRIAVRQVPVQLAEGESGIVVAVNFQTLANVVPPGARPDLAVSSAAPGSEPATLDLSLENRGNRYLRLTRTRWTFEEGGRQVVARGQDLFGGRGNNLIPPHARRRITVSLPQGVSASSRITVVDALE